MRPLLEKSCLCLLLLVVFVSCSDITSSDEEENDNDSDSPSLEAVIDYNPQNPETETEVTLDASNSEDDQDIGYEVQWSFENKPSNSSATIENATSAQATFTPDVGGDYEVILEITNESEGISDTETTTIAALDQDMTEELSGSINSDRTLEDLNEDPTIPDYLVTGNLSINANLTIDPGVVIHVQENLKLQVETGGALIAEGTEDNSIVMTSSNKEGGLYWKGLFVRSGTSQNSLNYVDISYAGNEEIDFSGSNYATGVGVGQDANLSVTNSVFTNNRGFGLYLDELGEVNEFAANTFSNNEAGIGTNANEVANIDNATTFSDNADGAVQVFETTFSENAEETWSALSGEASYKVLGNLNIEGVLSIEPGAIFEMQENVIWYINGALIAEGTEAQKIEFTSANVNSSQYWKGLHFISSDARNKLDYVSLTYGGNEEMDFVGDDYKTIVGVDQDAKLTFTNSSASNSKGYGLYVDENGELTAFAENSFTDNIAAVSIPANEVDDIDTNTAFSNNQEAAVEIVNSTYESGNSSAWNPLDGSSAYRVTGNLGIDGDLTIAAGTNFELDEDVLVTVTGSGSISAEGTSDNMIQFTTSNLNGQLLWKGLLIRSSSSQNKLEYVKVSYAGKSEINFIGSDYKAGVGVDQGAHLAVTNSELSDNTGFGLYTNKGGILTNFSSNKISNNDVGVGVPADEVDDMDFNTSFSNNSNGAVNIFGTTLSSTKEVTWKGLSDGATYVVLDNLVIDGVLTLGQGSHFEHEENVQWYVDGALIGNGEPGNEVVLTSANIDGGILWRGLFYVSSDSRNALRYTKVSYGGSTALDFTGDDFKATIGVDSFSELTIENSVISNSNAYGVYAKGVTNDFESTAAGNTFNNNPSGNYRNNN